MTLFFCLCLALTQFCVVPVFASPARGAQLVFLGGWVLVGLLLGCRRRVYLTPVQVGGGFLFWVLVFSSAAAVSPVEGFRFALAFLPFLGLSFLTTAAGARDPRLLLRLANTLVVSGVVAALLGLFEYARFLLLGPTRSMVIPYLLPPDNSPRVGGMYGQPNLFALFLALALIAFFLVYLHGRRAPRNRYSWMRFIPFSLVGTVFFLTGSRSGQLAFGVVLLLLFWLVASRRYLGDQPDRRREFFLLLGCLMLGLGIGKALPGFISYVSHVLSPGAPGAPALAFHGSLRQGAGDGSGRILLWATSLLLFLKHPWLGIGPDNFKLLLANSQVQAHDLLGFVTYENFGYGYWSHNEILQLMAELGVGGLVVVLALAFYLWRVFVDGFRKGFNTENIPRLYLLLLILAILVLALFSWPLRYPALLSCFVVFLSLLPGRDRIREIVLPPWSRRGLALCLFAGLVGIGGYGYHEYRLGRLLAQTRRAERPSVTFAQFAGYAEQPFSEFRVLLQVVPSYVNDAVDHQDKVLARKILPYARRLASLQGAFWQWYDVARLFHLLGDSRQAAIIVQKAIDLQPEYQPAWQLQHRLNVEEVARKTGRPIEYFYPKLDGSIEKLMQEMLDDARNRTKKPD